MGGDGGVIASNRRYMRGAGQADATGDYAKASKAQQSSSEVIASCALTGTPLSFPKATTSSKSTTISSNIVCCPYGKLYSKEAAIEALLRNDKKELAWDVQSMKELYPVRFHLVKTSDRYIPTCPISGTELNGSQPCFAIAPIQTKKKKNKNAILDKEEKVNVLSQQGMREIGMESLQEEYGPFSEDDLIRLAPSDKDMDAIKLQVDSRRKQRQAIDEKKRKEKRKTKENDTKTSKKSKQQTSSSSTATSKMISSIPTAKGTVQSAKSSIAMAVASNTILSSLFDDGTNKKSEKEKNDNLFAR